jgi:hypothetical protein
MKGWITLAGLLMTVQATAPPAPAKKQAEKADVCEVAGSGAAYSGHYLELTGIVVGEQADHLLLTSKDCALGVKLTFSPEVQGHDDIRILFAVIQKRQGRADQPISGTFEGTYTYSEDASAVGLQVEGIDRLDFPKK